MNYTTSTLKNQGQGETAMRGQTDKENQIKKTTVGRMGIVNAVVSAAMFFALLFVPIETDVMLKVLGCIGVLALGVVIQILLLCQKEKLCKSLFAFQITMAVVLALFLILKTSGLLNEISDLERVKQLILQSGGFGILICFVLIIVNVVILPAPALVFYLAITAVYGSWMGFFISYIGVVIGSLIAFYIGRKLGKRAVTWIVGKEKTEKYSKILNKKGKVPFLIMQLLPFFPDDILCMVAGLSTMSYKYITLSLLLVKPFYIACVCFLGDGDIIPFHGWGIPVWIGILALILVFCVIYFKNQNKIDDWLSDKFIK